MQKIRNILFILTILALFGCESAAQKQAKLEQEKVLAAQAKAKVESEEKQKAEQAAKAKAEAEKAAEIKKTALSKILSKFIKSKDKFDDSVTYRHKNYNYYRNQNGISLVAKIIDGRLYAYSVYVKDDWIFHKEFIVKIGDRSESFDGKEDTNVVNGVVEVIMLNSSDSERLVQFIASASPSETIMVRLLGKFRYDYNLRQSHRQAIKDTWELLQLLK